MEAAFIYSGREALALLGIEAPDQRIAIARLLAGLPASVWQRVTRSMGLSDQQLAEAVSMSISTLTRRKTEGRFTAEESDRLLRLAELAARAETVFTSPERLHAWFVTPNEQLYGQSPLSYARTSIGAAEVTRVLERILDGSPA